MSSDLKQAFLNVHNKMRDASWIPGLMGRLNSDGTYTLSVSNKPGWVYVRKGPNGAQGNTIAYNRGAPLHPNLRVRMLRENGMLVIEGGDIGAERQTGGDLLLPPHSHDRLGPNPHYATGLSFLPLAVTPSSPPAMTVTVQQGFYRHEGTEKVWETADSTSLSAYVPSAPSVQHFVIVCLDRANNALVIVDGTDKVALTNAAPFTAAEVLDIVDNISNDYHPLAAVRFFQGQTTVRPPDIFMDLRLWGGESLSGVAPADATYITQTANGTLTNEQALSSLQSGDVQVANGTGVLSSLKSNLSASAAPTSSDDDVAGYSVGSRWIDTTNDEAYICLDNATGSAIWKLISGETVSGATEIIHVDSDDGITKDGSDFVSEWADQTGNGYDFTQATATNQPLWVDAVINSRPVVRFDGVDNYMTAVQSVSTYTALSIAIVIRPRGSGSLKGIMAWGNALSDSTPSLLFQRNGTDVRVYVNNGYRFTVAHATDATKLYVLTWDGTTWNLYVDGTAESSYVGGLLNTDSDTVYLGNGYNGYANVEIPEFYLYDAELSNTERSAITTELMTEYGL